MNTNNNTFFTRLIKHYDDKFGNNYSLSLFDLKKNPVAGKKANILTTPTFFRDYPIPQIKVTVI